MARARASGCGHTSSLDSKRSGDGIIDQEVIGPTSRISFESASEAQSILVLCAGWRALASLSWSRVPDGLCAVTCFDFAGKGNAALSERPTLARAGSGTPPRGSAPLRVILRDCAEAGGVFDERSGARPSSALGRQWALAGTPRRPRRGRRNPPDCRRQTDGCRRGAPLQPRAIQAKPDSASPMGWENPMRNRTVMLLLGAFFGTATSSYSQTNMNCDSFGNCSGAVAGQPANTQTSGSAGGQTRNTHPDQSGNRAGSVGDQSSGADSDQSFDATRNVVFHNDRAQDITGSTGNQSVTCRTDQSGNTIC